MEKNASMSSVESKNYTRRFSAGVLHFRDYRLGIRWGGEG